MAERSDAELVVAAKAGDERALDELLSRHEKQVFRFGLRMCDSEEEAKEVLQETLLTAFRGIHSFRGEARLSTWLYQVARTHCYRTKRLRAGAPKEVEPLDSPAAKRIPSVQDGPDEMSYARQMGEVLHAAILTLPETYRQALILRDLEGLSGEEAAREAGIEERALKSRLHRARAQLRDHLAALLRTGHEAAPQMPGACPMTPERRRPEG